MGLSPLRITNLEPKICGTDSDLWPAQEKTNKPDRAYRDYFVDPEIPWYKRILAGAALPVAGPLFLSGCGSDKTGDSDTSYDYDDNGYDNGNDACIEPDADGDGYESEVCGGGDCNDGNAAINPGTSDVLIDCLGDDDAVYEPNDSFETATEVLCNEEILGAMSGDDDVDYYMINSAVPLQIGVEDFVSGQNLIATLYNGSHRLQNFYTDWVDPPVYVKVSFEDDNGLEEGDPSYTLTLTCDTCEEGVENYSDCSGDTLNSYDECGNLLDTDNCEDSGDICYDDRCCWDYDRYDCGWDPSLERWYVGYWNECYQPDRGILYYCADDEVCMYCDGGDCNNYGDGDPTCVSE